MKKHLLLIQNEMQKMLSEELIGIYIHGSLAMGGFNPNTSDVDLLIVTKNAVSLEIKKLLVDFFLTYSNKPYPIEVSILNECQLINWEHPTPFDFHYSEYWRERYKQELINETINDLLGEESKDGDLAAHISVINERGICLVGEAIKNVFPVVPRAHFLSSILRDFQDCLENVEDNPIYCTLNMLRVYQYLVEGNLSSKEEAGVWGLTYLPQEYQETIQKVLGSYRGEQFQQLAGADLLVVRDYIKEKVSTHLSA